MRLMTVDWQVIAGITIVQARSREFLQAASASFSEILGGANCSATVTAKEVSYARRLLSAYVELDFSLIVTSGLEESNVQAIVKESVKDGGFLLILSNKTGLALTAAPPRDSPPPSASPLRYSSSSSSSTLGTISSINIFICTHFNMYTCVRTHKPHPVHATLHCILSWYPDTRTHMHIPSCTRQSLIWIDFFPSPSPLASFDQFEYSALDQFNLSHSCTHVFMSRSQ